MKDLQDIFFDMEIRRQNIITAAQFGWFGQTAKEVTDHMEIIREESEELCVLHEQQVQEYLNAHRPTTQRP